MEVAGSSPVIRSKSKVSVTQMLFYFTEFFDKQGARRRPLRKQSGVALRPPPVAERGSKALSEIRSKRKHIYVQRIATVFQTVNLKIKSVDEG